MVEHLLLDLEAREGAVAEFIAFAQPTSPFLLPEHITECLERMAADPTAASAQTVVECPHNHHAYNQRVVVDGMVSFRFPEERRHAYSKQTKPKHYLFGNLIVVRSRAALEQGTMHAEPSRAVPIEWPYDFDADGPADFRLGELLLENGFVKLPFLSDEAALAGGGGRGAD